MIPIYTKITFSPPASKYGRKLPEITREAHRQVLLAWWKKYCHRHFTLRASNRYGYKPRSEKYRWRKGRLIQAGASEALNSKHDLVLTGLTRAKSMGSYPWIKAFPTRAKLTMFTPSYITMKPNLTKRNAPYLSDEILRIIPEEKAELDRILQRVIEQGLRAIKDKRTVIITG
jgi:hypothetical protein